MVAEDPSLSAEWRPAFERVPRHLFTPRVYRQHGHGVADVLDDSAPGPWLAEVYRDEPLVVRVDERDHDTTLSSSSAPGVMWAMLDALDVSTDHQVLEIGTGTGYNAAVLCDRLGSANVTSVDIDAGLVADARARLAALGHAPTLAALDGAGGYPPNAPYDRLLATCAVGRVPAAWIAQVRPGGLVCATMPHGMVTLRVAGDGRAEGRFHPVAFAFMAMRGAPDRAAAPLSVAELFRLARGDGTSRTTPDAAAAAVPLRSALWMVVRIVAVPDLAVLDLGEGTLGFVDRASGAWARVSGDRVVEGGPRRLWSEVERIHGPWHEAGEPDRPDIGLSVEADGRQRLWLRDPGSGPAWAT